MSLLSTQLGPFLKPGNGLYQSMSRAGMLTVQSLGDSMSANQATSALTAAQGNLCGYTGRSFVDKASQVLGGRLRFDLTKGEQGLAGTVTRGILVSNGTGYKANDTFTGGGVTVTVATVDGNGKILTTTVTTPGSGLTSCPTLTYQGSTGSGAVMYGMLGGHGTLGGAGNTSVQILARIADATALAGQIGIMTILAGTNDIPANVPFATGRAALQSIYDQVGFSGIVAAVMTIPPRVAATNSLTSAQIKTLKRYNHFIRAYASGDPVANPNGNTNVVLVDAWANLVNPASATDDPLPGMTVDGLHPTSMACDILGAALAKALIPIVSTQGPARGFGQADAFDATYHPGGPFNTATVNNAVVPGGQFLGSGGTFSAPVSPSTLTATGAASPPSSWRLQSQSNAAEASGSSITATNNVARTDGVGGNGFGVAWNLAAGSGSKQSIVVSQTTTPLPSGVVAGTDGAYVVCDVLLSNLANFSGYQMAVIWKDAATNGNTLLTQYTGTLHDFDVNGTYGLGSSQIARTLTLKSPAVQIPSGAAAYAVILTLSAKADVATATGSAIITNADVRRTAF